MKSVWDYWASKKSLTYKDGILLNTGLLSYMAVPAEEVGNWLVDKIDEQNKTIMKQQDKISEQDKIITSLKAEIGGYLRDREGQDA